MEHSQTHKKTLLVDTQDRKLSRPCIYSRVDMNMITQLCFNYTVTLCLRTRCSNATAIDSRCHAKSTTVQNMFQPIPGLINCAVVTGRWAMHMDNILYLLSKTTNEQYEGTETPGHAMTGKGTPLKTSVF